MALRVGGTAVARVMVGTASVARIYVGTALAWAAQFAMGIVKSTAQELPANTVAASAALVTGWTVDPTKPNTPLASDGIQSPFAAAGTVTASVTISFSSVNHLRGLQLVIDGAVVATDSVTGSRTEFTISYPTTVAVGTLMQLRAFANAGQAGNRTVTAAALAFTPS